MRRLVVECLRGHVEEITIRPDEVVPNCWQIGCELPREIVWTGKAPGFTIEGGQGRS